MMGAGLDLPPDSWCLADLDDEVPSASKNSKRQKDAVNTFTVPNSMLRAVVKRDSVIGVHVYKIWYYTHKRRNMFRG